MIDFVVRVAQAAAKPALALFSIFAISLPASADQRVGGYAQTKGNSHARAVRTVGVSAAVWPSTARADSIANLDLTGKLLGTERSLARVELEAHRGGSTPNRARVRVKGLTVYDQSLPSSGGTRSFGPYLLTVFSTPPFEILNLGGWASVRADANAGAGAQFGASWDVGTSPLRAHLSGAGQIWGNAQASLHLVILWGAADIGVSFQVNFFNNTANASLLASAAGLSNTHASLQTVLWRLRLKLEVEVLGIEVYDHTFVDEQGPTNTISLL